MVNVKKIAHLWYPARCPFCDGVRFSSVFFETEAVCQECRGKPIYVTEPSCKRCGKPIEHERQEYCYDCQRNHREYTQGKAVWVHKGIVKESVYRFKYQNRREYAAYYAQEIVRIYGDWIRARGIDGIVPVPLHKSRRRQRGYNQAELLAQEVGRRMDLPVYPKLLLRVRKTKAQKRLDDRERKNNLKKAFKIGKNKVQLEHILIIDDIYTTGSTINEAAAELKKTGAVDIYYISISIGHGY